MNDEDSIRKLRGQGRGQRIRDELFEAGREYGENIREIRDEEEDKPRSPVNAAQHQTVEFVCWALDKATSELLPLIGADAGISAAEREPIQHRLTKIRRCLDVLTANAEEDAEGT